MVKQRANDGDVRVEVVLGDITREEVDVVVNAANAALCGGGGVDGAIHRAAGPRLLEHCLKLGHRKPGQCVLTPGFDLSAKYIVHAVGPVWRGGGQGEEEALRSCYLTSLQLAVDVGARSIAFPAISCGAYRYPPDRAARVVSTVVEEFVRESTPIRLLRFVCFESATLRAFAKALSSKPQRGDGAGEDG